MNHVEVTQHALPRWPGPWDDVLSLSLKDYPLLAPPLTVGESSRAQDFYLKCMKMYLSGDATSLNSELESRTLHANLSAEWNWALTILGIRLKVRSRTVTTTELSLLNSLVEDDAEDKGVLPHALLAETYFVLGQSFDVLRQYADARASFLKSAELFGIAQITSKECRAKLNSISSQSCESPTLSFTAEYLALAHYAQRVGELSTAGVCFINVAREYQRQKILDAAFENSTRANECLQGEFGNLHSLLCLAGHVDILIDQRKIKEARSQLSRLKLFDFVEVKEAIKVLELRLSIESKSSVVDQNCLPTWKERYQDFKDAKPAASKTPLELRLIEILNEGPKDKFELIETLYGQSDSFFACENRLKNLLNRVRNRHPGKLKFQDGKYLISGLRSGVVS